MSSDEYKEDFIYENQAAFFQYYNQELQKNGPKEYYSKKSRLAAMKVAANKIDRLDSDYPIKMEAEIRKKINNERKETFDEAKKQQKISKPVANSNKSLNWEQSTRELVQQYLKNQS